jgi:hypothetical protein
MKNPIVISSPDNLKKKVTIPNFFSLKSEGYFFREIVPFLDFDAHLANNTYTFTILKDSLSKSVSEEQSVLFQELVKRSTLLIYPLNNHQSEFHTMPIFSCLTNNSHLDTQEGYYEFSLHKDSIAYLKMFNSLHYSAIDWQPMEYLQQKYSKIFYKFFTIAPLLGITEFDCSWESATTMFDLKPTEYRKWRQYKSDFLADVFQEITTLATHPIVFEYSTHKSFNKNLIEDRTSSRLYFRIMN